MSYIGRQRAAELLGVTLQTITNYAERGYFDIHKVKGQMYISEESVLDFKEKHIEDIKASQEVIEKYKSSMGLAAKQIKKAIDSLNCNVVSYRSYGENIRDILISLNDVFDLGIEERNKQILLQYFGTGSVQEIAKAYMLSHERINQIVNKAMRKMVIAIAEEKENNQEAIRLQQERCFTQHKRIVEMEAYIAKLEKKVEQKDKEKNRGYSPINEERKDFVEQSIEDLKFSVRTLNALRVLDIKTIGDLIKYSKYDLLKLRNFGKKSLSEVEMFLKNSQFQIELGINVEEFIKE